MGTALKWTAGGVGIAAGAYAGYVGMAWLRYGYPRSARLEERDRMLDRMMPVYDVVERHRIDVAASADATFAAACEQDLMSLPIAKTIFKARDLLLWSERDTDEHPRGLLAMTKSIGWGELAKVPGREIVMGAVTQPWKADVVFRPLPTEEFITFNEPGYVKIAWTLRADPLGADRSIFLTETRAVATDAAARSKFRRYWAFLSPGVILIRRASLGPLKMEAERRATAQHGYDARLKVASSVFSRSSNSAR